MTSELLGSFDLDEMWHADAQWHADDDRYVKIETGSKIVIIYFPKPKVISRAVAGNIWLKVGLQIDLDLFTRVPLLKPKPEVNLRLYCDRHLEKSLWRHYFAEDGPITINVGRHMQNHIEKQQMLMYNLNFW